MKINLNSWHFKLFNLFRSYSKRHYLEYETVNICKYFSLIVINTLVLLTVVPFVTFLVVLMSGALLEPFLVLGNYVLGNGWEPILGSLHFYANNNGTPSFSAAIAGGMIWVIVLGSTAVWFIHSWWIDKKWELENIEYEERPASFDAVVYERFRNWKNKHCTIIEFVED